MTTPTPDDVARAEAISGVDYRTFPGDLERNAEIIAAAREAGAKAEREKLTAIIPPYRFAVIAQIVAVARSAMSQVYGPQDEAGYTKMVDDLQRLSAELHHKAAS